MIGLTGAIGSGKSAATAAFAKAGARTADADQLARSALHSAELRPALLQRFGPAILDLSGEIDRQKLAALVFEDAEKLEALNAIVHPAVAAAFAGLRASLKAGEILVYDVPLLFEKARAAEFDLTITISAPTALRFERANKRNGWSRAEFDRREAAQMSLAEKEQRADLVLENAGDIAALEAAAARILAAIAKARQEQTELNSNHLE